MAELRKRRKRCIADVNKLHHELGWTDFVAGQIDALIQHYTHGKDMHLLISVITKKFQGGFEEPTAFVMTKFSHSDIMRSFHHGKYKDFIDRSVWGLQWYIGTTSMAEWNVDWGKTLQNGESFIIAKYGEKGIIYIIVSLCSDIMIGDHNMADGPLKFIPNLTFNLHMVGGMSCATNLDDPDDIAQHLPKLQLYRPKSARSAMH